MKRTVQKREDGATRELVLQLLLKPHSANELAAALDISRSGAQYHLRKIRGEGAYVFIVDWVDHLGGGVDRAVYQLCTRRVGDVPKPVGMERAEHYGDPEKEWEQQAKMRASTIKPYRDPLIAAFFGPAK